MTACRAAPSAPPSMSVSVCNARDHAVVLNAVELRDAPPPEDADASARRWRQRRGAAAGRAAADARAAIVGAAIGAPRKLSRRVGASRAAARRAAARRRGEVPPGECAGLAPTSRTAARRRAREASEGAEGGRRRRGGRRASVVIRPTADGLLCTVHLALGGRKCRATAAAASA